MHELSVAESILDVVEEAVGPAGQVAAVHLILGPLSGVSPEALLFCFSEVARPRRLGSPKLIIEQTAARIHCRDCGLDYESSDFFEGCPQCASLNREILSGHEMTVDWVELVEDPDEPNREPQEGR